MPIPKGNGAIGILNLAEGKTVWIAGSNPFRVRYGMRSVALKT